MANFYDVNTAIQKPNVLGAMQQGLQFGQQQRALREQRADQQQLRSLSPKIQQGDPGAFMQAAAIDPQAASAQLSAGDLVTRRMEPLIKLLEEADARNPQEAQALWQSQGVPFVRQFSQGNEPVADWQQAKPMVAQLKTKIEMAKASQASADPTGFRELHMKAVAAGYQPGTEEYQNAMRVGIGTEGRASNAGFQTIEVENAMGGKDRYTFDPRTNTYVPFNQAIDGMRGISIDPNLPQNVQDAIRSGAFDAAPDGGSVRLPDRFGQDQYGKSVRPGVAAGIGMLPGERTFAEESGKQRAQLEVLGARGRLDAENEARKETARTTAEKAAERQATYITEGLAAADSMPVINRALTLLDTVQTGGFNAAKLAATNFFGVTGADEGELSGNLGKAVLSQLRSTFGAAFTEKEGERLIGIEAGFGKSPAVNKRLLEQAKTLVDRAARRGAAAARAAGDDFSADEIERGLKMRIGEVDEPKRAPQQAPAQQGWSIQRVP